MREEGSVRVLRQTVWSVDRWTQNAGLKAGRQINEKPDFWLEVRNRKTSLTKPTLGKRKLGTVKLRITGPGMTTTLNKGHRDTETINTQRDNGEMGIRWEHSWTESN